MKRVIVIGCPGSGKSTFSKALHAFTGLPLFHLDMIYHRADRTTCSEAEFDQALGRILGTDRWILDGNYMRTLPVRLDRCDTVLWLDYPLEVCLQGIEARRGKPRSDMPWVETEEDPEFLEFVRNFHQSARPEIQRMLETCAQKRVEIFQSREMAEAFLDLEYGKAAGDGFHRKGGSAGVGFTMPGRKCNSSDGASSCPRKASGTRSFGRQPDTKS